MSKLHFRYGTMGSGKTIDLLKIAHNYEEKGFKVCIFTPKIDDRFEVGYVSSRIGISKQANIFDETTNLYDMIEIINNHKGKLSCILIDEAQFLTKQQVDNLGDVVDSLGITVICYGLRTNFKTELFEGSKRLFEIADEIEELTTICKCSKKTIFNMQILNGKKVIIGDDILIGGDEKYEAVCRECYSQTSILK